MASNALLIDPNSFFPIDWWPRIKFWKEHPPHFSAKCAQRGVTSFTDAEQRSSIASRYRPRQVSNDHHNLLKNDPQWDCETMPAHFHSFQYIQRPGHFWKFQKSIRKERVQNGPKGSKTLCLHGGFGYARIFKSKPWRVTRLLLVKLVFLYGANYQIKLLPGQRARISKLKRLLILANMHMNDAMTILILGSYQCFGAFPLDQNHRYLKQWQNVIAACVYDIC